MSDRTDLIFEAARLHYEEGLKQDDVARLLKVSRPTVARYLAMAKEMQYVHTRVLQPKGHAFLHDLEVALCERYPALREALLTPSRSAALQTGSLLAKRAVAEELAERAAVMVDQLLTSRRRAETETVVAVARGEMIDAVIRRVRPTRPLPALEVLPMLGYLRSREYPYDANRLAEELARLYAGDFQWIPAPAVVTAEEAAVLRTCRWWPSRWRGCPTSLRWITSISCPLQTFPKHAGFDNRPLLQSARVAPDTIEALALLRGALGEILWMVLRPRPVAEIPGGRCSGCPWSAADLRPDRNGP